ncbi:MAG: hypothetical protein EPN62_03360 [Candidimonas sp.]|nr:MAG: hypothetical protein EPN62_03360 [Candidimonas sp.]
MTSPPKKPDIQDTLLDAHFAELTEMTDEEILDGEDPEKIRAEGLQLLQKARVEAGRRRLAKAKVSLEAAKAVSMPAVADATPMEALRYLEQAANNPLFTMAARSLSEMSDEDILRRYRQLRRLEQEADPSKGDEQ